MRITSTLLLLALLCAVPASALDRKPRKKRKTPAIEQPAPAKTTPEPETCPEPNVADTPAPAAPRIDDMTLGLSAAQVDSLVAAWNERQRHDSFDDFFRCYILDDSTLLDATNFDATPDSVYRQRLFELVSPIQLPYNDIVKGYIRRYTDPRYGTIARILGMSKHYFPMIEDELLKENLPVELRVLPIIESALTPAATSRAGAAGLWQFIPSTGKYYGLEVNSLVDERRDPVRSTQAACRYLKDLYAIYRDWTLTIAAYNCGPGNVNKAIARSGGKTFWEIYDYLPRETRGYVPAFIGASYAYAYHRQHGIEPTAAPLPLAVDTVHVAKLMHLEQVASTLELPIEVLRRLNPQYRLDIVPATDKRYKLVLPQQYACRYIACEEEIHRKDSLYLKEYIDPVNVARKRAAASTYLTHTVKRGDTLGSIARKYRVSQQTIMRDNGIRNANRLSIGQKLKIRRR